MNTMNIKTKDSKGSYSRSSKVSTTSKPTAISAASMGKALVLLATSCAAFQSQSLAPAARTIEHHALKSANSRTGRGSGVALRYRDGSDIDQPVDLQMQGDMDEYIEFLEKRYTRLHPATSTVSRPRVTLDFQLPRKVLLSKLKAYLRRTPPTTISAPTVAIYGNNVDPLQTMGLSGLASAQLRERLHLCHEDQMSAIMTTSLPSHSETPSLKMLNNIRRTTDAYASCLASVTNFFSLRIIPKLLLDIGGFSVATLAFLLLAQPLLKGAFRQA